MHCRTCGKEVNENAVACMSCGMNPRADNKFCHSCGVETKANQVVCIKCGVSLAPELLGGLLPKNLAAIGDSPLFRSKKTIRSMFLIALFCFVLPFVTVSCQNKDLLTASGARLAIGLKVDMGTGQQQAVPPNIWILLAVVSAVVGLAVSQLPLSKNKRTLQQAAAVGGIGGLAAFALNSNPEIDAYKAMVDINLRFGYWLTLGAFAIAGLVAWLKPEQDTALPVGGSSGFTFEKKHLKLLAVLGLVLATGYAAYRLMPRSLAVQLGLKPVGLTWDEMEDEAFEGLDPNEEAKVKELIAKLKKTPGGLEKFRKMFTRSREGATKGNISALMSAKSNYYADQQGLFPEAIDKAPFIPNYIDKVPPEKITGSDRISAQFDGKGGWVYEKETGNIYLNLEGKDSRGLAYKKYGYE